ncbi:MAG: endolytic transglycosylase MltG, partial [Sphingobacteriia bacterium]|nr:endolytic transglycosylase MltG [Sphingobacteriia bacterium]
MSKFMKKKTIIIISIVLVVIALISAGLAYAAYWYVLVKPNVKNTEDTFIFIKTNSTYNDVVNTLQENDIIDDLKTFEWVAEKKQYPSKVKAGKYLIKAGTNNNDLINMLRSGDQVPVFIEFNSIRTAEQLAGRLAEQIEADSLSIINLLNDTAFIKEKGFDKYNRISVFIPNTYEIWWNTSAEQLYDKMYKEYKKFWNEKRLNLAKALNMSQLEVISLASIVEQETAKNDEKPRVAGVYLNRIKTGMPLQADPTLIFAAGDFSIRRVLNHHKEIESPFNTYKYAGIPPGPISVPSISAIDAVLNAEPHNYIFFCAKDDFSGYHNFA